MKLTYRQQNPWRDQGLILKLQDIAQKSLKAPGGKGMLGVRCSLGIFGSQAFLPSLENINDTADLVFRNLEGMHSMKHHGDSGQGCPAP